jgi:hypothetical protein
VRTRDARIRCDARIRFGAGIPLAVVIGVLFLAGCGGSAGNAISSKTPAEILAVSRAAATSATSVHVVSKASQGPLTAALNLQLASNGGRAQVSLLGLAFEVIRIGETVYLKGSPSLYQRLGITTNVPQGSWLTGPASGQLGQLAAFTDLRGELGRLLPASNALLTKGANTSIDGQQALELKATGKLYTGALDIATTGKPYPIKLTKHGKETGQSTFNEWNKPITLNPPTNTTNLSQLQHR